MDQTLTMAPDTTSSPRLLSAIGTTHLVWAMVSARSKDRRGANAHLAGARRAATALGTDGNQLGARLDITDLLVSDWAPHPAVGDKLLFIFHGGTLNQGDRDRFELSSTEIAEARFFAIDDLPDVMPDRLARRVAEAARHGAGIYLEHGRPVPAPVDA